MILFKGGQQGQAGLEPCYDGHTLAGAKAVAGDGLSAISIKQCHRHCHFTLDPDNKHEPLLSCIQGLQARNSFFDLHKPDLRKVRGLECSTTASVTQLLRSHNPDNAGKPTIKRRLFKLLEALVSGSTTKASKLGETKLLDLDSSLWPANICVLSTCANNAEMNTSKHEERADNSTTQRRKESYLSESVHGTLPESIPISSKQAMYEPLNSEIYLGPSTSSGLERSVFIRGTYENSVCQSYEKSSNLSLERKTSLTKTLLSIPTDRSMNTNLQKEDKYIKVEVQPPENDLEIQCFGQTEFVYQKRDLGYPNVGDRSFESVSEDLDDIISYIASTNKVLDILELDNLSTPNQRDANRLDEANMYPTYVNCESKFQTNTLEIQRQMNRSSLLLKLEEEQISVTNEPQISQRKSIDENNSSIITIDHDETKECSLDYEDSSLVNYYEEDAATSKYSYWEDDDLSIELSMKELFVSNIQSDMPTESKHVTAAVVPVQYFEEFWETHAFPYAGFLGIETQNDELLNNQYNGYFHWENLDDENILEEAENIMHSINEFLVTNIGLPSHNNTSISIVEIEENKSNDTFPNFYQPEDWDESHENLLPSSPQILAEHTSNQSLYNSSYGDVTTTHVSFRNNQSNFPLNGTNTNNIPSTSYFVNRNEETIFKRGILQKTHDIPHQIKHLKICNQDELALSNLEQTSEHKVCSADKDLRYMSRQSYKEHIIKSKHESQMYYEKTNNKMLPNNSRDTEINTSNVLTNDFQVTCNDDNQELKSNHNIGLVDKLSTIKLVQNPIQKKDCQDEVHSKFLFSSPQIPLNLTNPLNNTTYK